MRALILSLLLALPITAIAETSQGLPGGADADTHFSVWEGQLRLQPAANIWRDFGIDSLHTEGGPEHSVAEPSLPIAASSALEFSAPHGSLQGFSGGRLQLEGTLVLQGSGMMLTLESPQLRPSSVDPLQLRLTDQAGAEWFVLDHMHFKFNPLSDEFRLWNVDLRLGAELAARLGREAFVGHYVGQAEIITRFQQTRPLAADPEFCQPIRWPGTLLDPGDPEGDRYQADVELIGLSGFTVNRCATETESCDGPGGVDARMVISPSAELRNSNAANTAAVPWFEKFSGNFPPYGNDQHPFLIWNIYRIEADQRLLQIARSGVKHAFLTVNSACQSCPSTHPQNNFHILWPNCRDTYGTGNNDTNRHLGPRSEIAPNSVRWGRCGSIYDLNCDGGNDFPAQTRFDHRTEVRESEFDPALHADASYQFEGWYLVREDVDIYNTMGARSFVPSYSSGWLFGSTGPFSNGPVIDRWVAPGGTGLTQRSRLLVSAEGQLKAAVKVIELEPGRYLYHYAVANFTLAREITQGSEPNLRLLSNSGLGSVRLGLPADASLDAVRFHDGDYVASNDWLHQRAGDVLEFSMLESNSLDWGSLYSFSFESDRAPLPGQLEFRMAELGEPASYQLTLLVPTLGPDDLFRDGAEGQP
jgi:hypothetical protein